MDIRESILARLVVIGAATDGMKVYRNADQLPAEGQMPALLIFDSGENADEADPTRRPTNAPRRMTMEPSILLLATGSPSTLGTTINALRAKLVRAIVTDATLIGMTMNGEGIRYGGCQLDLYQGEGLQGHMLIDFSFTYLLLPEKLVEDVTV